MARYDMGWGPPPSRQYDRGFQRARPGGYGPPEPGFAPPAPWQDAADLEGVYGPARYGLGPYHERLKKRRRPDDEVRKEVEEALFYDTWVDAEAIGVEVEDGIVVLRGELPNYEEIRYATDDAWDVEGVLGVRSELSVRGG